MRKYFLSATLLFLLCLNATAQMPQLTVDGKTNNGVHLQALKIEVKVCGTVARTTWQMTFKNTSSKILEGNLNFPLKDGMSVSRYALDINGKMREAVPVDRNKGTEVFETIERRRVDPGLLEKVDGNTFRTRIYPINPNSTRTVLIGYEEELTVNTNNTLQYYLPLNLKDTVSNFNLDVAVIQSAAQPVFDSSLNENLQFSNSKNVYTAAVHKLNYVPDNPLAFSIPKPLDAAEVMLQEFENKYYFLINTTVQKNEREKILPATVGLLWDASLSGSNRNTKNEIALLDAYFKKLNNATVNLVVFSNTIKTTATFNIVNGNWEELKNNLATVQYDGATNFGLLNLKTIKADEFILVSDGLQTLGNKSIQLSNKPVYCINTSSTADFSNLKFIASKTGAVVINLQQQTITDALKKLTNEPFRFLGIRQNNFVKENYPSMPVAVNGNFAIAGIADQAVEEIIVQFGYGNTVTTEKNIRINAETQLCENFDITKIFAQKKIAELDIQYNLNQQEIEKIGKQFGIVTRNTSLIVLETINDYIQYQIDPPAELMEEYNRIMKERNGAVITKKETDLQSSLDMMAILKDWYDQKKEVVKKAPAKIIKPAQETATSNTIRPSVKGTKIISGRITDKEGNAISFATIQIKGTSSGISADANGNYSMRVKTADILKISAVSYKTVQLPVTSSIVVNTVLERENNTQLNEVVVVGSFGTKRAARSTSSSVQNTGTDNIDPVRQSNINNALAGRVYGAQVTQSSSVAGAATTVRLRGENGLATNSAPLNFAYQEDLKDKNNSIVVGYGTFKNNGAIADTIFVNDNSFRPTINKNANDSNTPLFNIETFDYLKTIKQTEKTNRYLKYLELRQYYISRPTYFFDVATYFLKTGDKTNGLTILTNLAELENGNYELYKMLGYKLKEAGEYEGELAAFKKVMELRPSDPQSFRDCALAYLDLGNYQQALDLLYQGMTKSYSDEMNRMYNGIEEVFLTEINRIIALHKKALNLKNIDKKIITPMPTDVRVVMNWNKNNTDIDLWVTDPDGEKCLYSNKETAIGGRISDDFTEGFGPEQFILKSGIKGKYRIQINYYNDRQVTIAGPTTVMAEIYLHYGTASEEKKTITLQMEKVNKARFLLER